MANAARTPGATFLLATTLATTLLAGCGTARTAHLLSPAIADRATNTRNTSNTPVTLSDSTNPVSLPATPAAAPTRPLTVMTVNLQHRDRPDQLKIVADLLKADPARTPDFILCQEVMFNRGRGEAESTAHVLASFMGYHARGTKRTSDSEGTAIVSRFPIEHYEAINLKAQTSRLLLGFRRVSTLAEVTVPNVGRVRLVNVHFTNWGFEQHVRRAQLRETLEWAANRESQSPAALTFLAGDFNARMTDSEMALVSDRAVTGPLNFADHNGTAFSRGPNGAPDRRIDYIFVSPNTPRAHFRDETLLWKTGVPTPTGRKFYLSDHLAVVHRYHITTPQPPTTPTPTNPNPNTLSTLQPTALP